MAEVVAFGGGCIPGEPSADLVEILEGLLERARSGHLTGLAMRPPRLMVRKAQVGVVSPGRGTRSVRR